MHYLDPPKRWRCIMNSKSRQTHQDMKQNTRADNLGSKYFDTSSIPWGQFVAIPLLMPTVDCCCYRLVVSGRQWFCKQKELKCYTPLLRNLIAFASRLPTDFSILFLLLLLIDHMQQSELMALVFSVISACFFRHVVLLVHIITR